MSLPGMSPSSLEPVRNTVTLLLSVCVPLSHLHVSLVNGILSLAFCLAGTLPASVCPDKDEPDTNQTIKAKAT